MSVLRVHRALELEWVSFLSIYIYSLKNKESGSLSVKPSAVTWPSATTEDSSCMWSLGTGSRMRCGAMQCSVQ